jgi:hypothetical protein
MALKESYVEQQGFSGLVKKCTGFYCRTVEAQPKTSLLSVEASSVTEPSMSITTQISMSMQVERQRRVGIITGRLADGIAVLMFASIIAVLCLQKRCNVQEGDKYRTKDHEMDIDDYDDIDGECFFGFPISERCQSLPLFLHRSTRYHGPFSRAAPERSIAAVPSWECVNDPII